MEAEPALTNNHEHAVFFNLLHLIQSILCQVKSIYLEVRHQLDRQVFDVCRLVQQLKQVGELLLNEIVVHQSQHRDYVVRGGLLGWGLH